MADKDFAEFARIIARNFPDEVIYEDVENSYLHIQDMNFNKMRETGEPEVFTVAWIPGLGKIDIVFTPDY